MARRIMLLYCADDEEADDTMSSYECRRLGITRSAVDAAGAASRCHSSAAVSNCARPKKAGER